MACWNAEPYQLITHSLMRDRAQPVTVVGHYDRGSRRLQVWFMRWEGEAMERIPDWHAYPQGWAMLWPKNPVYSESASVRAFAPMLPQVASGELDGEMEKLQYKLLPPADRIKVVEHPEAVAQAIISRNFCGLYEIRYIVYAPNGRYFPVSTPSIGELDWEWGIAKDDITITDDLESAERAAISELAGIVRADSSIKKRKIEDGASTS